MSRYGYGLSRKHRQWISLIVALVSLVVWFGESRGWFDTVAKQVEVSQPGLYSVTRFVDGDTITIDMNGTRETIRFIGIDTPETHKPNTPVQCYGPAAAAQTKTIISRAGSKVRLAADPQTTNRDRYDRLLRYVYLPDGTLINQLLVENGYAFYYPYFPFTKSDAFDQAQQRAQKANKGLWGNCSPTPTSNGGYKMEQAAG